MVVVRGLICILLMVEEVTKPVLGVQSYLYLGSAVAEINKKTPVSPVQNTLKLPGKIFNAGCGATFILLVTDAVSVFPYAYKVTSKSPYAEKRCI